MTIASALREYRIFVCPECGHGPETTALVPGCGPRMIEQGRNLHRCKCGFRGAFVALLVTAVRP